ncbi:Uma2 family endonuclease [Desulfobacterales bacterium HSG2]|nr:Uma2 family endonuclease [Desulfobacterales bacterium HSG2]
MEALQTLSRSGQTHRETYGDVFPEENGVSKDGLAVSEEEYWEKYYNDPDFVYEWNNGYLEVMPMSDVKGSRSYRWFGAVLDCYLTTYPVGTVVSLEIGFRLALPRKIADRIPDLAVVLNDNPIGIGDDDRKYDGIFDLCVESLSHSSAKEIRRDTVHKKNEYSGGGVREYYILDARGKETVFYRLNRKGRYVRIRPTKDGVLRSGILPGFQFRISDLYTCPPLEELAEDGVYHDYVFPSYKEVIQRAEQAEQRAEQVKQRAEQAEQRAEQVKQRAEQAEQRAEQAEQRAERERLRAEQAENRAEQEAGLRERERLRAERLAEKLRAMGIDPDEIGEF